LAVMQHLLVGPYGLATLLVAVVLVLVLLVWGGRKAFSKPALRRERYFKLLYDVFTLVPVAVLLWNLMVYNFANTAMGAWLSKEFFGPSSGSIAFPDAIAGVGELPILIAVSVVVFRLVVDIWVDITR
jgi:heme A synthase